MHLWITVAKTFRALKGRNKHGTIAPRAIVRGLKPALKFNGDVIPGLRSLRALTRGYYLSPLRGWLS